MRTTGGSGYGGRKAQAEGQLGMSTVAGEPLGSRKWSAEAEA